MKILHKEKSKLLERTEIKAEVSHTGKPTPNTNEIKKELSKELNADENLVVVKNIYTNFGQGSSKINAYLYDNTEELKRIEEIKHKKKKAEPKKEVKQNG